ncbi:hypothetical protein [Shewanella colwelliana]|uniref:hypothetical protein n=1 Tax=Shewanella colwelliana TaxID=23 RepID=UPI0004915D5C|nr:hypothetical protein [Shewanella colwelliana]
MLVKKISSIFKAIIGIAVIIGVNGCKPPVDDGDQQAKPIFVKDVSLCDFYEGICIVNVGEDALTLNITPANTPSEKPLSVSVNLPESAVLISARVEGRDMFMGIIPLNLSQTAKTEYKATLIYGSCSSNYMVWRMFVTYRNKGVEQTAMFDFLADNDI